MSEENELISAFDKLPYIQQCQIRETTRLYLQQQKDAGDTGSGDILDNPALLKVFENYVAIADSPAKIDQFYNHLSTTPGGEKMKPCIIGF